MTFVLSPIFVNLPEDVKYLIYKYSITTPSSTALKTYLGWYKNYLRWGKKLSFKNYYFTKLKRLDKDIFLSLVNYKVVKKKNEYYVDYCIL